MTTIAWDGKTVAYDSQSTVGSLVLSNQGKCFFLPEGSDLRILGERALFVTVSGSKGDQRHAYHFMRNCTEDAILEMEEEIAFCVWVFSDQGRCWAIQKMQGKKLPYVYHVDPPAAAGSGHDIAMTAMYLGKDAREAVMVAGVLDCYTDTNINSHPFCFNEVMK